MCELSADADTTGVRPTAEFVDGSCTAESTLVDGEAPVPGGPAEGRRILCTRRAQPPGPGPPAPASAVAAFTPTIAGPFVVPGVAWLIETVPPPPLLEIASAGRAVPVVTSSVVVLLAVMPAI